MEEKPLRLMYFAWIRERTGVGSEEVTLPAELKTVADLVDWLCGRDESYRQAFASRGDVRVAVNQEMADFNKPLEDAREVAFFPPMTGG